jgi:imidazolonepropionase-like amidohydrolase
MDMGPEELRVAINAYLDKGPNFVKYGGTSHFRYPTLIGFSPRQQRVIVEETHKRGLVAETHATSSEALRIAVEAGIDFIQHPEILSSAYPQDLIDLIVERGVICGLRSNTLAGEPWREHLAKREQAIRELEDAPPPATSAEARRRAERRGDLYQLQRENAVRLIQAGCPVTIATDNYQGSAPEFRREAKPEIQEAGIGSLIGIEGLVELGMTPMEALVAATHNGAMACKGLDDFGTLEVGKVADLVLLDADPLADIRNIRAQSLVMARGQIIDTDALPRQRIFYTGSE